MPDGAGLMHARALRRTGLLAPGSENATQPPAHAAERQRRCEPSTSRRTANRLCSIACANSDIVLIDLPRQQGAHTCPSWRRRANIYLTFTCDALGDCQRCSPCAAAGRADRRARSTRADRRDRHTRGIGSIPRPASSTMPTCWIDRAPARADRSERSGRQPSIAGPALVA